jgi:hypothetical protein
MKSADVNARAGGLTVSARPILPFVLRLNTLQGNADHGIERINRAAFTNRNHPDG